MKQKIRKIQCRKKPKWELLTRQDSQTKIFSPRHASNQQPSAWEGRIITTGGVNKLCSKSGRCALILWSHEKELVIVIVGHISYEMCRQKI